MLTIALVSSISVVLGLTPFRKKPALIGTTQQKFIRFHNMDWNKSLKGETDKQKQNRLNANAALSNIYEVASQKEFNEWYKVITKENLDSTSSKTKEEIIEYSQKLCEPISSNCSSNELSPMENWMCVNSYVDNSSENNSKFSSVAIKNTFYDMTDPNSLFTCDTIILCYLGILVLITITIIILFLVLNVKWQKVRDEVLDRYYEYMGAEDTKSRSIKNILGTPPWEDTLKVIHETSYEGGSIDCGSTNSLTSVQQNLDQKIDTNFNAPWRFRVPKAKVIYI